MAKRVIMGENGTVKMVHSDHGDIASGNSHEGHSSPVYSTKSHELCGHHHPNPILGQGAVNVQGLENEHEEVPGHDLDEENV